VSNRASLQDNLTAVDIENKNLSSAGTQKFMLMYSSPDQIELLKQQFPNVYNLINRGFENMANAQDRARAIYAGAGFQQVLKVEEHVTSNGSLPPTNNVEDAKANSEIANILGKSAIRELAEKSIVPTPENARLSAGFIETALKDRGPRLNDALKEEANIKAAIANMPDGIKAEYLANVNKHIENVISPQGQLANNVGVLAKVRKSADAVIPKDSSGNPQSLVKLQVDANGFITPLIEPNPAYKAPKGLLEGVTPQGKQPTSRTGMTTVPAPSARPSMVTIESNKELTNAGREVNNVVTIAAAASATERKAMAQRFVEAYNTQAYAPNYGNRPDGTSKGTGWLGELKVPGTNSVATEYSITVNFDGKEQLIPTIVPTLTKQEQTQLLDDIKNDRKPSKAIVDKAVAHARTRIAAGKSPFIEQGETNAKPKENTTTWDDSNWFLGFKSKQ
jgi:hypothetical protein